MNILEDQLTCNRILVTDDEPEELFATARILEKSGYTVDQANSGEETIKLARKVMPDLVLLDVVMPGMDGFEVCKLIKSDPLLKDIFVVLLSSIKKTPDYQAKGLDAGADGFIARPFHSDEFIARIRSIMRIKAVEKVLRIQRQWLRITLSSIGDGLIATDRQGKVLFMNPVAEKITGWSMEDARTKDIAEVFKIVDGDRHEPVKGPIGKVLKEGSIIQLDDNVLLIKKNQEKIPVADSASPIRQDDGSIIGGVLVFRDITEKKEAQEQVTKALHEWGAMFRAIGEMTLILDRDHGVIDANDIALERTGLTRNEIIGRKCYDVLHEGNQAIENCPLTTTLQSGTQETSAVKIRKLEGDYLVSCTPILNDAGEVERVIHIATDITTLKKAEKELRENEEKYRTLFKSSSDALFLVDVETRLIIDANETATTMYGFTHEEFVGLDAMELFEDEDSTTQALQLDYSAMAPIRYHRKKDGTTFPVEVMVNFFELNGRKTVLESVRDVSARLQQEEERRSLEKQLRQVQKMEAIGTLSSGIAHDFNKILYSVIGYAELALENVETDTITEKSLQEIYAAGQRAKDLVKQILDFSRQDSENLRPMQLGSIVKEVVKFLRSSIPSNIEISINIKDDNVVQADPTQMHQILMNLCTNAAQAMEPDGGRIELNLSQVSIDGEEENKTLELIQSEYMKLSVSDTGIGIPKENIDSIFEPYFTTKPPSEGTGLGLATVHGIVKRHRGSISVSSTKNQGTTFDVHIPVSDQPQQAEIVRKAELPKGDENILFVDDEEPLTKMVGQILTMLGYGVTTRTSSIEALELFKTKSDSFDLVITDMTMPNMTGDRLAKEMMKIRPDIPIILCTGYSKKITEQATREMGIRALTFKPLVRADLAKTVRDVLDAKTE